jgi:hypothetical protein
MPAINLFDAGWRKSTQSDAGQGCVEVTRVIARSGKLINVPNPRPSGTPDQHCRRVLT